MLREVSQRPEVFSLRLCLLVLRSEPSQPREVLAAEELLTLASPKRPWHGAHSPKQCPVCAVGRGIHSPAVTAATGKELWVVFTPEPATGDSPNRSHLIQIRAEHQVTSTLLVCLCGGLRLSHTTVTSKTCHLAAPCHCTCSAGQKQLLTLCQGVMPAGSKPGWSWTQL